MEKTEIDETMRELSRVLHPNSIRKIESLMVSIWRQVEDLKKSRDLWRSKFEELKGGLNNGKNKRN